MCYITDQLVDEEKDERTTRSKHRGRERQDFSIVNNYIKI